ncbi:sulfurtransferase complex subunit TusB [Photobacterium atrarenae]|uniref:Sulfurtransferase complex subunit TusB n=1 Tax=Photobacterium atrarenae TaxID=865757 RepID=A0ABY5GFV5_9GAMM|nr:sulfurtransferase complex subunit TusB [Photobacterium atrarenae]UTV27989.1 sulfurtransferase complex subunit TusB [Photobacterium atrarenae]
MLHTISTSPFQTQALQRCLRYLGPEDEILLIQDAVVAGIEKNTWCETLALAGVKIYLLEADLLARGLRGQVVDGFYIVDLSGFVELTVRHDTQMKWA